MPIRVRYKNLDEECTIRPTPLYSISTTVLKDGAGEAYGSTYTITLQGTLLADMGTPYAIDHRNNTVYPFWETAPTGYVGPYGAFDNHISHFNGNKPPKQKIDIDMASTAIMSKQRALRALFAQDGQRLEITDIDDDGAMVICYPRLVGDIQFEEGIWIHKCPFTITLECDTILYGQDEENLVVDREGTFATGSVYDNITEDNLISLSGTFIQTYNNDWAVEVDDQVGESPDRPRSYRITHNINATGKTHYMPDGTKLKAWEQARTFVQQRMGNNINDYPNVMGMIGSGTINLINSYGGYNHVRSENINEADGSYAISETWLIASGSAYENYSSSTATSTSDTFINVSINGTIKGLTAISPSGYGGSGIPTAFDAAQTKYYEVSNSGQFGLTSDIYKRANSLVAVQLNSQPLSISVATNKYLGEIAYDVSFDNRPTNIISGVLSEDIQINETYPGDVFATIPIIGRTTGPILQYIGGRTEFKRDLSINLQMDYTKMPYGSGRNPLVLKKPSVIEPTASQIANLIRELSPEGEPGIRKYFVAPPTESWNPRTGAYSFNLSWTYEIDS